MTPHLVEIYRSHLIKHIPQWATLDITNTAKHLGLNLGPDAKPIQWNKACKESIHRAYPIAGSALPAATSALGVAAPAAAAATAASHAPAPAPAAAAAPFAATAAAAPPPLAPGEV